MVKRKTQMIRNKENSKSKFCGIIGTAYCGSTMLSYILGSSEDIFSTGELNKGFPRYKCAHAWHNGDWTKGRECRFWTEDFAKDLKENTLRGRNKKLKAQAQRAFGKKIVFNADKGAETYRRSIDQGDDVDCVIVLFKKPQAFAYSHEAHLRNRSKKNRIQLLDQACNRYYSQYNNGILILKKYRIPHIFVQYEDLAENTEKEIKRICRFLNAKYSKDMIPFWNNKSKLHMSPSGNRGAHRQFLKKESFLKTWTSHLDPQFGDQAYHTEHAKWFLANYHKITLDEKWRKYLSEEEVKHIASKHKKTMNIYKKMVKRIGNG